MNRSPSEILAHCLQKVRSGDHFARVAASHLVLALPLESAKTTQLVKIDATEEEWEKVSITSEADIRAKFFENDGCLIDRAWDDANALRGMRCRQNLAAIAAFVWLLGPEHGELLEKIQGGFDPKGDQRTVRDLDYYGKRQLVAVCEHFGVAWMSKDNDEWPHVPGEAKPATAADVLGS